ncbi:hypothetical protein MP638_000039 [Amoeboaphelidium occidentale]|nr:hypothetical protein MP638_000039 [Amoeboaphelidium occidentale]
MKHLILRDLERRGLIYACTSPQAILRSSSSSDGICVYTGFDPTADSLHIGNLLGITMLARFHLAGHSAIALVGGATGLIGDPSGKSSERSLLPLSVVERNSQSVLSQIQKILKNTEQIVTSKATTYKDYDTSHDRKEFRTVNNIEWLGKINLIEFMAEYGKHVRVSDMLARDSVRSRMKSTSGISFTEFSYQIFQAYDYYHLNKNFGCNLQFGGSDQWGNILAGIDLIRRKRPKQNLEYEGFVYPLLTTRTGSKFGKSEGNAIWLDSNKTSPFDFYQFFYRIADDDVEKLLKYFTLLPVDDIDQIIAEHKKKPEHRLAQQSLAEQVTLMTHGEELLEKAKKNTRIFYSGEAASAEELNDTLNVMKISEMPPSILDLLTKSFPKRFSSKNTVRNLISNNGLTINGKKWTNLKQNLTADDFANGTMIVKTGKDVYIIKLEGQPRDTESK